MQIVNIMQCTELGGMEQSSFRLMQALHGRGHRCSVVSLNPLGRLAPYLEKEGIDAVGLSYRGRLGWRSFPALRRVLRGQDADALIMTGSNILALLALGQLSKGRRLLAMHFHHSGRPAWQWNLFYRLVSSGFDAVTYPSDFIRDEAIEIAPFLSSACHTIRNPLAPPDLPGETERSDARATLGLPGDVPIVGNAGWLIPRKRFDVFLNAAAGVSKRIPSVRFAIAGSGSEEDGLRKLARNLGIADQIFWLGWVEDMRSFYMSLDVLLFNSDWDAWGNTPVEAMSFGVPVVASVLNGGLKEIISEPAYGTLLDVHDVDRLTDAVVAQLTRQGEHTGARGRERAIGMSDPERIAGEVEALLRLAS
jgi:glycosyltransferase involved in cell wall biosynthesis